jgi:hypothetical protein
MAAMHRFCNACFCLLLPSQKLPSQKLLVLICHVKLQPHVEMLVTQHVLKRRSNMSKYNHLLVDACRQFSGAELRGLGLRAVAETKGFGLS